MVRERDYNLDHDHIAGKRQQYKYTDGEIQGSDSCNEHWRISKPEEEEGHGIPDQGEACTRKVRNKAQKEQGLILLDYRVHIRKLWEIWLKIQAEARLRKALEDVLVRIRFGCEGLIIQNNSVNKREV